MSEQERESGKESCEAESGKESYEASGTSFEQRETKRGTTPYARSDLERYCEAHSSSPSALCAEINSYTQQNFELARMIVGPWHAGFLQFLLKTTCARRVLEIGTFTGYSALAMAEALPADGEVVTIDINVETTQLARSFWDKSAAGKKIKVLVKPALEVLQELERESSKESCEAESGKESCERSEFDFVFIDADKENVRAYFEAALRMLSKRGMIAVDNSFMDGEVLSHDTTNTSVQAMAEFNDYLSARQDLHKVLINIRDGIFLITRR